MCELSLNINEIIHVFYTNPGVWGDDDDDDEDDDDDDDDDDEDDDNDGIISLNHEHLKHE